VSATSINASLINLSNRNIYLVNQAPLVQAVPELYVDYFLNAQMAMEQSKALF